MTLEDFDKLCGGGSYVRLSGKVRQDSAVVNLKLAKAHIKNGGQIGWWVRAGYIVVDVDEGKQAALKAAKHFKANTLLCKTPKGLHMFFKTSETFTQRVGMILPYGLKCDYRCALKGYVMLPFGSNDPKRVFNNYTVIRELPDIFTPLTGRKESLFNLQEGEGRNTLLFSHLMAYKNRGATQEEIESVAEFINTNVFASALPQSELIKIFNNTTNYQAANNEINPYLIYNKDGYPTQINHRAVCDHFVNAGTIFVMNGECYQYNGGVYKEASLDIRNQIRDLIPVDKLISQAKIMECFKLITDDIRLQKSPSELNADSNLINFKNGVWDIENQKLLPHNAGYFQTIQIPHNVGKYRPFTRTRLFSYFKTCNLDKANILMITQYMAYCLTLDYGLKTFMILYGPSNTGKSVLIRFIESMVGVVNTAALSMHELNARFYPAQLYGKMVNSCADNSALPLSSIETLKKITGGDQIMHERKGKDPFFFVPFAKLIFSFNQLPLQLEEKSNAFYKRMRILTMQDELYLDNAYVTSLCADESIEEIIPFLLSLLPLYSINNTKESRQAVEGLRRDSDSIHAFISKRCRVDRSKTAYIEKSDLYAAYVDYCIQTGREAHKRQNFMRNIKAMGYNEGRDYKTRAYVFYGLSLKKGKG